MTRLEKIILAVVILLVIGTLGFLVFLSSQSAKTATTTSLQTIPTTTSTIKVGKSTSTTLATYTIKIEGDQTCQEQTIEALNLLQTKAPVHYKTVTHYIGVIECIAQGSAMLAYEKPPRFQVGAATSGAGAIWYAGTIAHDSCHSKLYHEGKDWIGKEAEATCLDVQYDALSKIGASQDTLDYVKNLINTEYWNVPYEERWW